MSFLLRYSNIEKGGISFIGNTLGLSKLKNKLSAGSVGSIGAFISLDNSLKVADFPNGTTLNYLQNGSSANLDIPLGSEILYAELIWGGLYLSASKDITSLLDNPIVLTSSLGTNSIYNDPLTASNIPIESTSITFGFYVRSSIVTDLISNIYNNNPNDTLTVSKVPAIISELDSDTSQTSHAGWTLAVIYKNSSLPIKSLSFYTSNVLIKSTTPSESVTCFRFISPLVNTSSKVFVSAGEGDATFTGDSMLFGDSTANLTALSTPNNPVDNFFCSQINDSNGQLVTSGTFGDRNSNPFTPNTPSASRQGWDITAVNVSSLITPNQNKACTQFITNGDTYMVNGLGFEIESLAGVIEIEKQIDKSQAEVGEIINYTLKITNTGDLVANDIVVSDPLPNGASLVPLSIVMSNGQTANNFPITIDQIAFDEEITISYQVIFNELPQNNPAVNTATANYKAIDDGENVVMATATSNAVECDIYLIRITHNKNADKAYSKTSDTITYTFNISNNGSTPHNNVFFVDTAFDGATFVPNSVYINGVNIAGLDPNVGFNLPSILPNEFITVKFSVTVN